MTDLLDFECDELYFDEPLREDAKQLLDDAAEAYGDDEAEVFILRAYFLEPEHPMVLVALYRFFYYQHRLEDALTVADRVLTLFSARLNLPSDWRELDQRHVGNGVLVSMTMFRFYLWCLKGAGYLELRLGNYETAIARLQKLVELDSSDRLGGQALLNVATEALGIDLRAASA
ncbi:MAG: hypothetical protein AB2807_09915 [Candidatus Sedimenticola endophacoides]